MSGYPQLAAEILVPMKIDAWINYAEPRMPPQNGDDQDLRAYVSSIPNPNFNALKSNSTFISHDIFEHLRSRPRYSNGDPERRTLPRSGIYLTWTLPRMYRTGLTASTGVEDFDRVRQLGGYPKPTDQNASQSTPIFREVPSTWIICRTLAPAPGGAIFAHTPNASNGWSDFAVSTTCTRTYFVVQSNVVRQLSEIPPLEDIENTTSPFIDYDLNPGDDGKSVLGKTSLLADWEGDGDQLPGSKTPVTLPRMETVTVSRTANPYFADFQPYNSSVFSMFDDLSTIFENEKCQLCDVKVSYTVVGYHRDWTRDPLCGPIDGQSACDRLKACQLQCDLEDYSDIVHKWNKDTFLDKSQASQINNYGSLRTFCHGSMFNIYFSQREGQNDSLIYPGDDIQQQFVTSHPLAVGTNALDALFGWLRAKDTDQSDLRADLLKLQTYVLDSNDDLDSQLQAEDLLATNNFIAVSGETQWHFAQPDKQPLDASSDSAPAVPLQGDINNLQTLNNLQSLLDARSRQREILKQQMFDLWWKCVVGQTVLPDSAWQDMKSERLRLRRLLDDNMTNSDTGITNLTTQVKKLQDSMNMTTPVQATAGANFYIQQDPTLLISGTTSGWPQNFNDDLSVRLPGQSILETFNKDVDAFEKEFVKAIGDKPSSPKLSFSTSNAVSAVIAEAITLQNLTSYTKTSLQRPPLYFPDEDRFVGNNGWFPLFIEWEAEYYHIAFENWTFKPCGPESRYAWCLKDEVDASQLPDTQQDYRVLNGRIPLLPQAAAGLEAILGQVFSKTNPDQLNTIMDTDTRTKLLAEVRSLEYLSAPMSGLFDQLITRRQGAHFQPVTYSHGNNKPAVVPEAQIFGNRIDMTEQDFLDMDSACATTPLTDLTDIPSDTSRFSPFKACTHGQFRFTKLNIVDRYGQMVDGIRTSIDLNGNKTTTPLFPCLGEAYSVQDVNGKSGRANTVIQREDGLNSFVQLPPSINQHARVNARFVTQESVSSWRRIQEWETPVLGWLVVNYANTSIQIYSSDGIFVREYSIVSTNINTKPFQADPAASSKLDPTMLDFLTRFLQPGYLLRLFQNITQAVDAIQASPSHYAESMLSTLGKPLALVTFGYSIELSQMPLVNQQLPSSQTTASDTSATEYTFPVKVGDKDNVFDGLLGLFGLQPKSNKFDFDNFQCYHDPDPTKQPQLQSLTPCYIDPSVGSSYISHADSLLQVTAALVDPFTPVHVYSAILPIKPLSIPPWCISNGLARISAFFKAGPTLLANDVPAFVPAQEVTHDYSLNDKTIPNTTGSVAIPAVNMGDWRWLQPYWVEDTNSQQESDGTTRYNVMNVEPPSQTPLWEPPPCVITDGYLQMAKPFTALQQSAKEGTIG